MLLHVMIRRLGEDGGRTFSFNRSAEWVGERIVEPWERGNELVINGEHWEPRRIRVAVRETANEVVVGESELSSWAELEPNSTERTDELLARPAGSAGEADEIHLAADRRKVMVVMGRNSEIGAAMFEFLRAIDLRPLEWTALVGAANTGAPYIGQVLDEAFAQAQAVVVLSTPDDIAHLRPELVPEGDPEGEAAPRGQARPNVFYEAGLAIGRFPNRTIFVEVGTMRPASDLGGIHTVRMNEGPECRRDLAQRLERARCEVDMDGTDWLSAGTFSAPGEPQATPAEESGDAAPDSALVRRIDAFLASLTGNGQASTIQAQTFNQLLDESGIAGIPRAVSSIFSGRSEMTHEDMRMLLNQMRAGLSS